MAKLLVLLLLTGALEQHPGRPMTNTEAVAILVVPILLSLCIVWCVERWAKAHE